MPIRFDGSKMGEIRFGNTRIAKVYFGNTLVYDKPYIKIKFYFDRTNINPRGKLGTRAKACGAEWLSTSDPHVWEVITPLYTKGAGTADPLLGVGKLFVGDGDENGLLLQSAVGTCQVLEITGDIDKIETLDRLFQKCTAITSVSTSGFYDKFATSTTLINVNSICNGDTGITDGSSLAGYLVLKDLQNINTHAATFSNADSAANLAQIPVGWGGTFAPPATVLAITKVNAAGWSVDTSDPNCPDFTTVTTFRLFTTASISKYDGVNMKKSNIWNKANGFVTSSATYYYPCFFQGTGTWPSGTSGTPYHPTWIFCSDNYNGMLTASQSLGDMPGTLDENSIGNFTCKYGTFDSTKQVYFGFLVLNNPADLTTFDSTTEFAIHSNSNFLDCNLNWYIPS